MIKWMALLGFFIVVFIIGGYVFQKNGEANLVDSFVMACGFTLVLASVMY